MIDSVSSRVETIKEALSIVPHLARFTNRRTSFDYDREADVLYISFERPQHATESTLRDDDVIVRTRNRKMVGLTVLRASRFMKR